MRPFAGPKYFGRIAMRPSILSRVSMTAKEALGRGTPHQRMREEAQCDD